MRKQPLSRDDEEVSRRPYRYGRNDQLHTVWKSVPFEVARGTGWVDPNGATDYQGVAPGGTVTFYDALGRVLATQDPSYGEGSDGIACSATLSGSYTTCTNYGLGTVNGDSNTYFTATSVDPNKHVSVTYQDALGRTVYVLVDSGLYGGTLSPNQQTATQYNVLNEPTQVQVTDLLPQSGQSITSVTTTAQYDDLGRLTQLNDPDRGTHTYTYDGDGRVLTDMSGSRTLGYSYDLLGRLGCEQNQAPTQTVNGTCTSGATQYVVNTYDTTQLGTQGSTDFPVGQLTKSVATTIYPDSSSATVTELYQHDQRGRLVTEQLSFPTLPSGWNVTTALPTYQLAQSYNDANQPTTTTTSTLPSGQGYTTTQVYDSTTGVQTGLSNNGTATATLATLSYNARAGLDSINFLTTTGTALMNEEFGYDANLRTTSATATWQSGSGTSGTAFSQGLSYDPASNLVSLSTTLAVVPGQSNSGGSETQNFCYDEQNHLVWAGNSGTQPSDGNGTCGSGTLSNTLNGASYSTSFVYTHLGQLWQGPINSGSTQYQYLYCSSSQPHQLTGLYPIGKTCSTLSGQVYTSSYDAWGNVTNRSYNNITATLSYDALDHFTQWDAGSTNFEQTVYDASGNRVLLRSTNSTSTTMTVYAFGLQEHTYSGSGSLQSSTYYYSLAGRLLGKSDGSSTIFYLLDSLGSVLMSFNNIATSAALKGSQVYGPYGKRYDHLGTIGTSKGFTGQYNDALTGLDYYGSRYYDNVVGLFLSADKVQGDMQGRNPFAYVDGNPETHNDPTGQYVAGQGGQTYYPGSPYYTQEGEAYSIATGQPYTGGAFVAGWLPTQGPHAKAASPKHLTGDQLDTWCEQSTRCSGAIHSYLNSVIEQIEQNINQNMGNAVQTLMSLFMTAEGISEGDADAFMALAEEDPLAAYQWLAEEEGVTLDNAVTAKLASSSEAQQTEGVAGAIAQIYSKLINFNKPFGPNSSLGEIDAETPEAIIEAKSGGVDIPTLIKQFNNPVTNPSGKPFVIYAPGWNPKNVQTVYELVGSLDTGQDLYITTNPIQLIEVLQYLQE